MDKLMHYVITSHVGLSFILFRFLMARQMVSHSLVIPSLETWILIETRIQILLLALFLIPYLFTGVYSLLFRNMHSPPSPPLSTFLEPSS